MSNEYHSFEMGWNHLLFSEHSFVVIMANSPEYEVMISSTNSLVNAMVAEDPKAISDDLVSQRLITHDLYKEMSLDSKTSKDKARKLVQAVTDKVKCNPSEIFYKFLVVLKQHKMSDLVATLNSKIGKS